MQFGFGFKFLFIIFSGMSACYSQGIENLVFEGAGIRGVAYVGALQELEEKGLLNNVKRVGGTSAGAIAAMSVALGYNSKEIEQIIYGTRLNRFNDGAFLFVGGLARLNRNFGWYRGKAITRWLEGLIDAKTGIADITFRQLSEKGFKDLYITGTSINNQRLVVFSKERYPNMKVKDAVRISVSIPLYFEAVCINSQGVVVNPKKVHEPYDIMADGGFTGNFPISVFDSIAEPGGKRIFNRKTIGFRIDKPDQIMADSTTKILAPIPVNRFRSYMSAVYIYVIENLNRGGLEPEDWQRTVSISSGSIGPKIRKLSIKEKKELIENGRVATRQYLDRTTVVTGGGSN